MATKEQMERVAQAIQAKILNIYPENRESDAAALVIAQAAIAAIDIPALEQAAYDRGLAAGRASIDEALDAIHERATVVHLGEVEFEQWYAEIYWNIVDHSGFPAKYLGSRKATGIEIEERYCEIAVKRLQQQVLPLEV